jgi:hypothetical protein
MPDKQLPIDPGQVTAIPHDNYDVNKELGRVIDRTGNVDGPTSPNLLFGNGTPYDANGATKVNPAYSAYLGILKNSPVNTIQQPYYTNKDKTDRYSNDSIGGYHPFDLNQENWYGENQSWFKQWGNHLGKFGLKTLGSFATSLMDIPNTVNAVSEGNTEKMWNNPTNTWASDLADWSEKNLPNYKTSWEQQHPFLNLIPFYGNSANSWGNIFEQVGFTVGAIGGAVVQDLAVGALTGGVGEVPLAAQQINKAVYNLGKLINAGEDTLGALKKTIKTSDDIIKGLKGIDRFNYAVRQGLWGANMITSGFAESAFEGIESYNTLSSDLKKQYFDQTATNPDHEVNQKIDNTAKSAANTRFLLNAALLSLTNSIQWGSLMRPFNVTKELIEEEAKSGVRIALKEGSKDVFEAIEPKSRLAKLGNFLLNNKVSSIITESGSEGFEEGAQFWIQNGVDDYYKRKYNNPSIDQTNNFMKSFSLGLSKTLGTSEGWENIIYGLLGGVMYKGGEHIHYKAKGSQPVDYRAKVNDVIQGLNSQSLTGIFENKYGEAVGANSIEMDLRDAAHTGNNFLYQNYKHEHFVNFVLSGLTQNKFETRIQQLGELKKLDDSEFQKTFGIPASSENRRTVSDYVSNLENTARGIKSIKDRVTRTFINPFNYKGTGNYKNQDEAITQNKENEKYIAYEQVKDQLVYAMSITDNSKQRLGQLRDTISSTSTYVNADTVSKLASDEGLKELRQDYNQRLKELQDGYTLSKDRNTKRQIDWHRARIDEIDSLLAEKDEAKQQAAYNDLLANVFDNFADEEAIANNNGKRPKKKAKFDRVAINELVGLGRDIYYLTKRNELAVNNYAALTTKGGFKKLFDEIMRLRAEQAEREVNLAPETQQPSNPQAQEALNQSQAKQGKPITGVPDDQLGYEETIPTVLTSEEQKKLADITVAAVTGKVKPTEEELEFLGFKTIDDLKAENPKVDLNDYKKVKSSDGKNMYMSNKDYADIVAKTNQTVIPPQKTSEVPPITPDSPVPDQIKGQEPLRIEDFLNKAFVPEDLKVEFQNQIWSGTKDQVRSNLSISVKPLSPEFQTAYNHQKANSLYTPVPNFPDVFVAKSPIDLSLISNGKEIGKIPFPERLLFKVNNVFVTLDKLTPEQYSKLTGRPKAQYKQDVENYNKFVMLKNYLAIKFKNNGNKDITLSAKELSNLFDINLTYGEDDRVVKYEDRPTYNSLKYNTVLLQAADGSQIETMAILSVPKRYVNDSSIRERTEFINIIFNQDFYDKEGIDDRKIRSWMNVSIDQIHAVNSRYIGVVEQPNGLYRMIALRPANLSVNEQSDIFTAIKDRAKLSSDTNFIESTADNSDGKLLIGSEEVYYKLPSDEAKKFNDDFNTDLNNKVFISDNQGNSFFNISVSPIGAIRLEVFEPVSNYKNTFYIAPHNVAAIKDFAGLITAFNKQIDNRSKIDPALAGLKLSIAASNFKSNIGADASVTAGQIAPLLTAAVTKQVFKNGTLRIEPNAKNVTQAYKEAGGTTKADVAIEKQTSTKELEPVDSTQVIQGILKDDLNVTSPITKDVYLSGLHYVQTSDDKYYVVPDSNSGIAEEAKEVTREQILKPFRTVEEWNKVGVSFDSSKEALNPQPTQQGIFGGFQQLPADQMGELAPFDVNDVSSPKKNTIQNQEDLSDIIFPTVKDALASVDIGYRFKADQSVEFYNISNNQIIDLPGMSPTDLVKEMKLKVDTTKTPKKGGFEFSKANTGNKDENQFVNFDKAKAYIESILPSFIKVEELNTIFDQLKEQGFKNPQREVYGAYKDSVIYLNTNRDVEIGVEYHEAFHAVFAMMSEEDRQNYLKIARDELYQDLKVNGKSIKLLVDQDIRDGKYSDLSTQQKYEKKYEEYMAERFRTWKNKKQSAGLFAKLFDLIRRIYKWFARDSNELDSLFRSIDRGAYRYSNIASSNFMTEQNDEYNEPEFQYMLVPARPGIMKIGKGQITINRNLDPKTSKQVVQSVAAYYNLYRNLDKLDVVSDDKLLDAILDDLKNLYSLNNPLYAGYTQEQQAKITNSDEAYIYSNEETRNIIKDAAKNYINSIKYIEQFQDEENEEAEQDTGAPSTGYDNRAENVGGFSSLPGLLRQYIGFTTYEKTDGFGNKELRQGIPVIGTVDSVHVYYGLMRALANITDPVKFFQKMILFADENEQSRFFVEKFISDTGLNVDKLMAEGIIEATKNKALVELVKKGFNKFRIDYIFTEHDIKKGIAKSYHANRRNVENVQFDKWANNFISNYSSDFNELEQRTARQYINDVQNKYFDERRIIKYDTSRLNDAAGEVQTVLRNVGIYLSKSYVKYALLSKNANKFDEANKAYQKEGLTLQFDDPQNKFISKQDYDFVQIMKIADEITLNGEFLTELSKTLSAGSNPFFKETKSVSYMDENTNTTVSEDVEIDTAMIGRILNVAKGNALFDETVGESSYTNAEDKIIYAHQDGTFHVKSSYQLRDPNYRRQLREEGYRDPSTSYLDNYDKEWLTNNFLLNSPQFEAIADNLLFQRIDGMRAVETNSLGKVITEEFRDQKDGVTYGHYSPRETLVNFLNMYVSYAKEQRTSKGTIVTTPHVIRILEASKTGDTVNLPINIDVYKNGTVSQKAVNQLYNEFAKEFNRISRVQNEIGTLKANLVENYHTGSFEDDGYTVSKGYRGLKFTDNITSLISKVTAENLEAKARRGVALTEEEINSLKAEIALSVNKIVDDTVKLMIREGLIRRDNKGNYVNVLLHNDMFKGNTSLNLTPKFKENIGHIIVNDYLNTLSYNQILHGDSALSLKNDGGIDAVKRAKGDNAAIVSMRTDLTDESLGITKPFTHSSVAIFKEPINKGIKIADAQMFTTVEGLRYTMWGLGRLTPRLARVLDALENGENIHAIKDQNGEIYDSIFDKDNGLLKWDEMTNSLKLVYKDGKSYFKMSVVVLQPDLTSYIDRDGNIKARPGWKTLHDLRTKMEADGIHFAAPESASKMMTLDVSRAKDFSDLKGHLFDNTYFGLQTVNPSNKIDITTPTQLLQLIDSEQTDDVDVYFNGKIVKVKDVRDAYQNFVAQRVNNNYRIAKHEIYEIKDFEKDVNESIEKGEVTPRLARFQKRALETLEASGADAQLMDFFSLDENDVPKYNLNMSATKTKFGQLYLAYFSKGILSQKNPGYTVALMSGIDTRFIRKATRILNGKVVEWKTVRREQFDTNHENIQNEYIHASIDDVASEGDYFLHELQYNVPEYDNDGNITGYFSEMALPAHFREMLSIPRDQELPDAITKGFGVRIPSEDKPSFISLKLVDFLPANLGSTGMFAKELVDLSGADFDIDKLYISRYDFYTYKDSRGNTKFAKYGDVDSIESKWEEYKLWMSKNNKVVKGAMKDLAINDPDYQRFIEEDISKIDLINDILDLDVTEKLRKRYKDKFVEGAFAQLGLPSTLEQFEKESKSFELNNGVLNNRIVDSYVALLTNDGMREIAETPASLAPLESIQKQEDIQLRNKEGKIIGSVFSKKNTYPVDSMIGKYYGFRNNTVGKDNIGIDVNANLIYSVFNKGEINLTPIKSDDLDVSQGFQFDGEDFNSFAGSREFNLDTRKFDGTRTNKILRTLISSATDEAKEQLNALYNLNVDALKVVNYMVGLKVPLKTAVYFVNQPIVRNYLDIKSVSNNTLRTAQEERLFKSVFKEAAIDKLNDDIKDYSQLSDKELFGMFEREGLLEVKCE